MTRPLPVVFILLALAAGPTIRLGPVGAAQGLASHQAKKPEGGPAKDSQTPATAPASQQSEETAWVSAREQNSPEAYANFLYLFPGGRHTQEAFRRLVRISEPAGARVTDVPFWGAPGPFCLDAFWTLDAQRHGRPIHVTEALVHWPHSKTLSNTLTQLADDLDPTVRLSALELLFTLDDLWWLRTLPPEKKASLEGALVPGLQALLAQNESHVSAAAAYLLWHLGHARHADPLKECLKRSKNPLARRAAADILGTVGGPEAIGCLTAALQGDEDHLVRASAAESLAEIGDPVAIAPLTAALRKDAREEVRAASVAALRVLNDAAAIEPLAEALSRDKSPAVRWAAACALGTTGNARAVAPLVAALRDSDHWVRWAAAETLGALRDPQAVDPLLALLADDKTPALRAAVIDALGEIGDARAIEPLVRLIRQEKRDADQATSVRAALALRALGDPLAGKLLFRALDDKDPQVRAGGAIGIGVLDASPKGLAALAAEHRMRWYRRAPSWPGKRWFDARGTHRLIESLGDEHAQLRRNAALALGLTGDARSVEPLAALLRRDPDGSVREAAAQALAMIDDPRTIDPLLEALADNSRRVVLRAAEALRERNDPRVAQGLIAALTRQRTSTNSAKPTAIQDDPLATEEAVRRALFWALASTRDNRAQACLTASLADTSPQSREAAALALGLLRDPRALEALGRALRDESSWVRQKAATALGMLGDRRAAGLLASALRDQATEVRVAALRAVAMLDSPQDRSSLCVLLATAPVGLQYRMSYWISMFCLGWRPAKPEDCVRLLAAHDQRMLLWTLWPSTKKVLLADAANADPVTVQGIAELLIALGKEEVLGDLIALLKTKGTKNLAAAYFYSGRKELREAAAAWAHERGRIQLPPAASRSEVRWGTM